MRTRARTLRGSHVLVILLVSFGIVFAVNLGFAVFAVETFPGEDQPQPYAQGVEYNAMLRDRAAQAALGWRADAQLHTNNAGIPDIEIFLRDLSALPLDGVQLAGALRRPTDAGLDRPLAFTPFGNGRYRASVRGLAPGQWDLEARAVRGGAHFDISKRLIWRPRLPS